jgi:hypothetical protein
MHVPKTAGTSISSLLEDNLSLVDALEMKKIRNQFYANYVDYALLGSAEVVAGHFPLSIASLMHEPVRKLVFLRNPVALSMSLFNHMKRIGEIASDENIVDFIESPRGGCIKNVQVKWLGDAIAFNVPTHRPSLPHEFGWGDIGQEPVVDDILLSAAKKNLERFEFIGIFEEMERSISLMCDKFGFSRGCDPIVLNVGEYSRERDESTIQLLRRHNEYDLELYRFARQCFEGMIATSQRDIILRHVGELKPHLFLDMDESIRHQGFHGREIWPHWHGVRWTSGSATIYSECHIAGGTDYTWELLVLSTLLPSEMGRLQVQIGDVDLEYNLVQEGSAWFYRGLFSSSESVFRPEIRILAPFATAPSELGISTDSRKLGVAVKSFKLLPVQSCALEL